MNRFTPIDNTIIYYFTRLPDFGHAELAVYTYIRGYVQNEESTRGKTAEANGKQGYAYTTKVRMRTELALGKTKLNVAIDTLIRYELIATRKVANKYGGRPLLEYKPLDVPSKDEFMARYGALIPGGK
jgi:hypothetical protein